MGFDHILLIGFGGPARPEDVLPFLQVVTKGTNVPEARLREVAHHYEQTGGFSPYNEHAFRLADRLRKSLEAEGIALPVFIGMRNWHPFFKETLLQISQKGLKKGIGVILAPHRSYSSFEKYTASLEEAQKETGTASIRYDYLGPWHTHPLFIAAQADHVRKILDPLDPREKEATQLIFCAHSIPSQIAGISRYAEEFKESSACVARQLKHDAWTTAYQSRSGPPSQPWLEPDIGNVIRDLKKKGWRRAVVVPVGFLFDHTEVLYDLDLEAKNDAREAGIEFQRASTVMDHPKFVTMFIELIKERAGAS